MSARIEKEFLFDTAVHFEKNFYINNYYLNLYMTVYTESGHEQGIAMERVGFFIDHYIQNAIFVDEEDKDAVKKYEAAGLQVLALPDEPYDQIIGCILLLKLNSIMEGRLHIDEIVFGSKLTGGVKFHILYEEAETFKDDISWWDNSSTKTKVKPKNKKEKVVKLFDDEWTELGLVWNEKIVDNSKSN